MEISINYLAVLAAGVGSMIVGFLWYGPLFGKLWMKLMGFTEESMKVAKEKGMGKSYTLAFIGALVTAYVIAHFVEVWVVIDVVGAFQVIFWPWLGFIVTTMLSSVLWEGKPWKLYVLNIAHYLVAFFVQALILTYWV